MDDSAHGCIAPREGNERGKKSLNPDKFQVQALICFRGDFVHRSPLNSQNLIYPCFGQIKGSGQIFDGSAFCETILNLLIFFQPQICFRNVDLFAFVGCPAGLA